jgi:hypothetical protein
VTQFLGFGEIRLASPELPLLLLEPLFRLFSVVDVYT